MERKVAYSEYTCDLCKKTSRDKKFLEEFILPGEYWEDTGYQGFGRLRKNAHRCRVEICPECAIRIRSILNEYLDIYMQEFSLDVYAKWKKEKK
ncbi:MAG: hypothetical protein IKF80_09205 [Erysipelotrichaceae bacterium]|nr:hypothetical protein [Erysipelotrichaceae bacterium]